MDFPVRRASTFFKAACRRAWRKSWAALLDKMDLLLVIATMTHFDLII
jgi:hypothetical protein